MTIGTIHTDWQRHKPAPDPRYTRCSPNLLAIIDVLAKRWGMTDLGCYGWRPVRDGTVPSTHGYGAAIDRRYGDGTDRRRLALTEILPWLINNSAELHISAIHDYIGCRIWHAGRTASLADAHTKWWLTQPANPLIGMGSTWAVYFHIETTEAGWDDGSSVWSRADPNPTTITGDDEAMYLAYLHDGTVVVVGSAVRPVSTDEIKPGGPLAGLPHVTPDPASNLHAWLAAGATEYAKRVMP